MKTGEVSLLELTDEVCPGCGDQITLLAGPLGTVEVECRCGCNLAVA